MNIYSKNINNWIERPLPIRMRYFTTKHNMPRLRYISMLTALVVLGGTTLFNGSRTQAGSAAEISDQASSYNQSYQTSQALSAASQQTLSTMLEAGELVKDADNAQSSVIVSAPEADMVEAHQSMHRELRRGFADRIDDAKRAFGSKKDRSAKASKVKDAKIAKLSSASQSKSAPIYETITLQRGDTLTTLLRKKGVGSSEAYRVVNALSKHYDPRKMKPGLEVLLQFGADRVHEGETYKTVAMLDVPFDEIKSARVVRGEGDKFKASRYEKEIIYTEKTGAFDVELSLFGSAEKAGVPYSIVAEAMRIYSWNVDFQRDLRKGDSLEMLYREAMIKETGKKTGKKEILYAKLTLSDRDLPIYRMEMKDGRVDYFQEDGHSIRKALMRTPINGGRISSGYGMRRHPVLGYNKMHKGLDFAAPTGTKIYAAGDGVIEYIGRNGGYGKYIRIRHNSKLKTAYAHLNRFEKGLSKGDRVRQGQVIGRVGTTGRSTGPHLHYEVKVNDRQVNPRSVKLPTGEKLKGEMLTALNKRVKELHTRYAMISQSIRVADASSQILRGGSGRSASSLNE